MRCSCLQFNAAGMRFAANCFDTGERSLYPVSCGDYACRPARFSRISMTDNTEKETGGGASEATAAQKAGGQGIRVPRAVRKRLRAAAVAKVRQDIIHAGRSEADYAAEDLEYLVAEKEKEIWSGIGWKGFGIVALLLGINIGI
jgi:hypothetical protein